MTTNNKFLKIPGKIWRKLGPNNFVRFIISALITGLIGASGVVALIWLLSAELPDLEKLRQYEPRLTTRILDRNNELLTELYTQRRIIVPLDRLPENVINAIIATEDSRFFEHWGLDLIGITRAAVVDVLTLSLKQGASTLSQQLARDLYLTKKRTFTRKIRETLTAIQIERNYSKREILEMYLTQVYFGHGAYGVGSAALRYFGKNAEDLTLEECALLAAVLKAPTRYSPLFEPERALNRRNVVLGRMLEIGSITPEQFEEACAKPLELNPTELERPLGIGPYFTEMIRQKLSEEGRAHSFDYLTDGLTVHTTLDSRLQEFAETAIDSHLNPLQTAYRERFIRRSLDSISVKLYGEEVIPTMAKVIADSALLDSILPQRSVLQVALVAMDPNTGDILAMVGGRDFLKYKFNRAVQAVRQPGSVFKPFVYTAAIDNGYTPCFELLNQDVVLTMADGTRWVPQNYDLSHGGMTTLREGLRRSLNLVTARLVQEVVPPRMVVKYAHQMGITTPIAAVDAIALGSSGVIPLEAVAAYCVFADGGIYHTPRSLMSIEDRFGEIIAEYPQEQKVALSAETAYIMTDMLCTVMNHGTGGSVRWRFNFYPPAAGKTGTTNDFTDAWFIGFTPKLACGVWVGLDDPQETLGSGFSGAVAALPIWAMFMKAAYDSLGIEASQFEMPPDVIRLTICEDTKQIATPYCPNKLVEVFRQDSRPLQECTKHKRIGKF